MSGKGEKKTKKNKTQEARPYTAFPSAFFLILLLFASNMGF